MERILHAARSGNVQILDQLHKENPSLLSTCILDNSTDNPLTVAIKANQLVFAREILKLNPELAVELNQDGIRPLDAASASGNIEIVRLILASFGAQSNCQLPGKDGRAAIHYAAMNGKTAVINELLSACPDCAKDVTILGETAVHLAVKCFKIEALKSLLEWLEKHEMVDLVINGKDNEGNTVLHNAVSTKQIETVELLLKWNKKTGNRLKVNATNKKGMTPMDTAVDNMLDSSADNHFLEILRSSGGSLSSHIRVVTEQPAETDNTHVASTINGSPAVAVKPTKFTDILKHFEFQWHRDSPGQARETLLILVVLFTTITFQAGINPPSKMPGKFVWFWAANTVALTTSMTIIDYLTTGLPFQRELRVVFMTMLSAYGMAMNSVTKFGQKQYVVIFFAFIAPMILRFRVHFSC